MAKVQDYYIGATHIEVYDDCVVTDPKKLDEIHKELGRIAYGIFLRKALREREAEKKSQEKEV